MKTFFVTSLDVLAPLGMVGLKMDESFVDFGKYEGGSFLDFMDLIAAQAGYSPMCDKFGERLHNRSYWVDYFAFHKGDKKVEDKVFYCPKLNNADDKIVLSKAWELYYVLSESFPGMVGRNCLKSVYFILFLLTLVF